MNDEKDNLGGSKSTGKKLALTLVVGMLIGALLSMAAVFKLMPSMMIVTEETQTGFDETVEALEKSIVANGWVVSGVSDMNKSMAKHGVEFVPRVKLVKLCNPHYVKSVLTTDRYVGAMMPCTFAVWEDDAGKVFLSKVNLGLMAKMFGGNIAKVMGQDVVNDEYHILHGIIKEK